MTTSPRTCFWCWRCLRVTDPPVRYWSGDLHRCTTCKGGATRVPIDTLRRFSFFREEHDLDEVLRQARAPGGRRRPPGDGYHTHGRPDAESERAEYRERWDHSSNDGFGESRSYAGPMTIHEARRILGLDVAATAGDLRAAFRRLAKKHHPDRHHSAEARLQAERAMCRINDAYRCLASTF